MRKLFYYLILTIIFPILTLMMPYYIIKEYVEMSSVGKIKFSWLLCELKQYYIDIKELVGMFVIE